MSRFLHSLSSIFFYVLGVSLFSAYLLMRNDLYTVWSAWWLQVADLPFLIAAFVYAGTSLYKSLRPADRSAPVLAIVIAVPLVCFFVFLTVLNFWTHTERLLSMVG